VNIQTCLREGDLTKALELATDVARADPTSIPARAALFELLCLKGDLERAHKQLDVIAGDSLEKAYGATALLGLLNAEEQRRAVFRGQALPNFPGDEPAWAKPRLAYLRGDGDVDAAALERQRPVVAGTLNGQPFEDVRDGDDLLAPVLEVFAAGGYAWFEWGRIRKLTAEPPRTLRDTLWFPVALELDTSEAFEAHVPVLYPGTHECGDERLMVGLETDWSEEGGGFVRGRGRRMLFANGEECDILAVRSLETAS
jgi:type VI secretion system protein ImpE